jgi:hypothetical protein
MSHELLPVPPQLVMEFFGLVNSFKSGEITSEEFFTKTQDLEIRVGCREES